MIRWLVIWADRFYHWAEASYLSWLVPEPKGDEDPWICRLWDRVTREG